MRQMMEAFTKAQVPAAYTANSAGEPSGPRDWKPPMWDGQAETFRDYLMRMKSSYRVRSATKPSLPAEYYWNAAYDSLPSRERARMRHFWEQGSAIDGKDPEAFFTQLEHVFADSNEQAKALEQLTNLRHATGQPWHEHQLEFDGLLLSAGGDSWAGSTKIGYLKNTFSNAAKMYTATVPKTTDYYDFSGEVERIMTNLETTDQFRAANRRWREKNQDSGPTTPVTTKWQGVPSVTRVDRDGDTIMAPAPHRRREHERTRRPQEKQRETKSQVGRRCRKRETPRETALFPLRSQRTPHQRMPVRPTIAANGNQRGHRASTLGRRQS